MLCQQYEQASGCMNCIMGGCARKNSCDMERCTKQCSAMMTRFAQITQSESSEQEIAISQCNRRSQRSSCQVLSNCLKKLEKGYQLED